MEKQEFLERVTAIGTCEDDAERRELLTQLSEEASKDYDTIATLTDENSNLRTKNETLRDANMQLFLRVGENKNPDEQKGDITGVHVEENKKRSFDELFNEKGEIK